MTPPLDPELMRKWQDDRHETLMLAEKRRELLAGRINTLYDGTGRDPISCGYGPRAITSVTKLPKRQPSNANLMSLPELARQVAPPPPSDNGDAASYRSTSHRSDVTLTASAHASSKIAGSRASQRSEARSETSVARRAKLAERRAALLQEVEQIEVDLARGSTTGTRTSVGSTLRNVKIMMPPRYL